MNVLRSIFNTTKNIFYRVAGWTGFVSKQLPSQPPITRLSYDTIKYGAGTSEKFVIKSNKKGDFKSALDQTKSEVVKIITTKLNSIQNKDNGLRIVVGVKAAFINIAKDTHLDQYVPGKGFEIFHPKDVSKLLDKSYEELFAKQEDMSHSGSGWSFEHLINVTVDTHLIHVPPGKGYFKGIRKKGMLNINTPDGHCLEDCLVAAIVKPKVTLTQEHRYTQYQKYRHLIILPSPIIEPPRPNDNIFTQIEQLNNIHICILTMQLGSKEIHTGRRTRHFSYDPQKLVILVYYLNQDGTQAHYCLVTNLTSLIYGTTSHSQTHTCFNCLRRFATQEQLDLHIAHDCNHVTELIFPLPGKNIINQHKSSANIPPQDYLFLDTEASTFTRDDGSKYQKANSYCWLQCGRDYETGNVYKKNLKHYKGPNPIRNFVRNDLIELLKDFNQRYGKNRDIKDAKIKMTKKDTLNHEKATQCYICHREFIPDNSLYRKVRDHNHATTKNNYIGAAHSICNLVRDRQNKPFPIIAHNMMGYDVHEIILEISQYCDENKLAPKFKVMPKNDEKYITVTWGPFIFMDSYNHLTLPLADLIINFKNKDPLVTKSTFKFTYDYIDSIGKSEYFDELLNKNIYAYEDEANTSSEFRSIDKFRSTLNQGSIKIGTNETKTNGDVDPKLYAKAKDLYIRSGMKSNEEWDDLYAVRDVTTLADVWLEHESRGFKQFGIYPTYFPTLPSYGFQAMLRSCDVELEACTDADFYDMENHPRGGLTMARHRVCDTDIDGGELRCFDMHNFYGYPMINCKLGYGGREWIQVPDTDPTEFILGLDGSGDYGYMLTVDIPTPSPEVQLKCIELPFFPDMETTEYDDLSDYQKSLRDPKQKCEPKLKVTFNPKTYYTVLLDYLQLGIRHGYTVSKIHRIMKFKQSDFACEYAQTCTNNRIIATHNGDNVGKTLNKLYVNSTYGKMLQNPEHHCQTRVILGSQFDANDLKRQRLIRSSTILPDHNIHIIDYYKQWTRLKTTRLPGVCILEHTKIKFYEFFYALKSILPDLKLIYTDTDSMTIWTSAKFDTELLKHPDIIDQYFDFSNYPKDHPLYSDKHYMIPGKMADEYPPPNKLIKSYALCAKTYYHELLNDHKKKAKGVKKSIQPLFTKNIYLDTLTNGTTVPAEFKVLRSINHVNEMLTMKKKTALNAFDDKFKLLDYKTSVPWGCTIPVPLASVTVKPVP